MISRWLLCFRAVLAAALLLAAPGAAGKTYTAEPPQLGVTNEEPYSSPSLAGYIVDAQGAPVPGVAVQLCEKKWRNCGSTSVTEADGRFRFAKDKEGRYFLRLSKENFRPTQVILVVSNKRRDLPKIRIEPAT